MEKVYDEFTKQIAEELYNIMKKHSLEEGEKEALSCAITNLFRNLELIKEVNWHRREVAKLLAISLQDDLNKLSGDYIQEKTTRILERTGIGVHPSLNPVVEDLLKKFERK